MRSLAALAMSLCAACSDPPQGTPDGGLDGPPPDSGEACATPPDGVCLDASTLRSSYSPGTLSNGACAFETFTSTCAFGCADGACQPKACTPSCSAATCSDDGCGGTCGPCLSGTTFPGLSATSLGIARDVKVASDGVHAATVRALQPLPPGCGAFEPVGTLDVWTVPQGGAATHRTIGARVRASGLAYSDDNHLVFVDNLDPCTATGDLWVARADGSRPHLIAKGASQTFKVVRGTVFYEVRDPDDPTPGDYDGFVYAVRLPDGTPRKISSVRYNGIWVPSPAGDAIWITPSLSTGALSIARIDGTSSPLAASPDTYVGIPEWSPDGKRLAYGLAAGFSASLHVINTDGTGRAMLAADCACSNFVSIVWAGDGSRLAWLVRPPTFGLDAHVLTFAGGAQVVLADALPNTGGNVGTIAFSRDGSRLHVASGSTQSGFNLRSAPVAASGAMTVLAPSFLGDTYTESADGSVLAVLGPEGTRVITLGGATQLIPGDPGGVALEDAAVAPRWLIQHGPTLSVFPLAGTGGGTRLPSFSTNLDLSNLLLARGIPFVFGWSGGVALFPAAPDTTMSGATILDLMAWTTARTGRLGKFVTHYRLAPSTARVYFTTADDGLFWVPRP